MAEDKGLRIILEPRPFYLPGSEVRGVVQLDPQAAEIDSLRVKFRGKIYTRIRKQRGQTTVTYTDQIDLFKEELPLWNSSQSTFPSGGPLEFPFAFRIPSNLPPTFYTSKAWTKGTCFYFVEAIGDRSGLFQFNRRARLPVGIFPPDPLDEALLPLLSTWAQGFRTFHNQQTIRQKPWHEKAVVNLSLAVPELNCFPAHTPIPFHVSIETISRLQKAADNGSLAFPCPPPWDHETLLLMSSSLVRAKGMVSRPESTCNSSNPLVLQGSLSEDRAEPEWQAETDSKGEPSKGRWVHRVTFKGLLQINSSPSFETAILSLQHGLVVRFGFGFLNTVKLQIPLAVSSGRTAANMLDAEWNTAADLPPSYGEIFDDLDAAESKGEKG